MCLLCGCSVSGLSEVGVAIDCLISRDFFSTTYFSFKLTYSSLVDELLRFLSPSKMFFQALAVAVVMTGAVSAQRPNTTSICEYYTTGLLMNNTAENQKTLLTLVVNTAVIGNCKPIFSPPLFSVVRGNITSIVQDQLAYANGFEQSAFRSL